MQTCPNCGAPLPVAAPGQVEVCAFCHAETREEAPAQPTASRALQDLHLERFANDDDLKSLAAAARPPKVFMLGVAVVVAGILAMTAYFLWSKGSKTTRASPAASAAHLPSVLALSDLRTAAFPEGDTWLAIAAPGMVGTYEAFDVVGNYNWASRIATSWNPGAVLTRVLVASVARDGTVDVSQEASVTYMFKAAGAGEVLVGVNAARLPATGGATPHVAILVRSNTSARMEYWDHPFGRPVCALAQAVKAAAKPLAKLDAAPNPSGRPLELGVTLSNDGVETHWVLAYQTPAPGTTRLEGHEAVVNAMTCALGESQ